MKYFFSVVAICFFLSASFTGEAQPSPGGSSFIITLVNATRFQDVDTILRGLRRSKEVQRVWESRAVQGVIEVSGVLKGDAATFKADLLSLTADRFVLESERREDGVFHVTLRKLEPSSP